VNFNPPIPKIQRVPWTTYDPSARVFLCRRCQGTAPLPESRQTLTFGCEFFLKAFQTFQEAHRYCVSNALESEVGHE